LLRHGRTCSGHPRLSCCQAGKTWKPGTSSAKTRFALLRGHAGNVAEHLPAADQLHGQGFDTRNVSKPHFQFADAHRPHVQAKTRPRLSKRERVFWRPQTWKGLQWTQAARRVKHLPADYEKNLTWVSPSRGRRRENFYFRWISTDLCDAAKGRDVPIAYLT
jgi:hypothetical protein